MSILRSFVVLTRRRTAVTVALLSGITLVPFMSTVFHTMGVHWLPAGDWAMIELRTRDVGSSHTPLVGPYSRYQWNHPGPMLFWLLSIPYRLSGGRSWGLLTGAALINLAAVAGTLYLAWRHGRLRLLFVTCAALSLLAAGAPQDFFEDPWNPWVTELPFALLLFAGWASTRGDRFAFVVAGVVGSFLVQSHVGYVVPFAVLAITATIGALRNGIERRVLLIAVFVLALCWLPPLIDQFVGGGNLSLLASYFSAGHHPIGMSEAARVMARELGGVAPWMGGAEPTLDSGGVAGRSLWSLVAPVALFSFAASMAFWRRAMSALTFQAVVAIVAVTGLLSVSRISDFAAPWLVRWLWIVAMCWWIAIGWSLLASIRSREALAGLAVALASSTLWFSGRATAAVNEPFVINTEFQTLIAKVSRGSLVALQGNQQVYLRGMGPYGGWIGDAVALQLERSGIGVVVDDAQRFKYGSVRSVKHRHSSVEMVVATGGTIPDVERDVRFRRVVSVDAPQGDAIDDPRNIAVFIAHS